MVAARALSLISACRTVLQHDTQLQSVQNAPRAKHSQYNFKQRDFLQLHGFAAADDDDKYDDEPRLADDESNDEEEAAADSRD